MVRTRKRKPSRLSGGKAGSQIKVWQSHTESSKARNSLLGRHFRLSHTCNTLHYPTKHLGSHSSHLFFVGQSLQPGCWSNCNSSHILRPAQATASQKGCNPSDINIHFCNKPKQADGVHVGICVWGWAGGEVVTYHVLIGLFSFNMTTSKYFFLCCF